MLKKDPDAYLHCAAERAMHGLEPLMPRERPKLITYQAAYEFCFDTVVERYDQSHTSALKAVMSSAGRRFVQSIKDTVHLDLFVVEKASGELGSGFLARYDQADDRDEVDAWWMATFADAAVLEAAPTVD